MRHGNEPAIGTSRVQAPTRYLGAGTCCDSTRRGSRRARLGFVASLRLPGLRFERTRWAATHGTRTQRGEFSAPFTITLRGNVAPRTNPAIGNWIRSCVALTISKWPAVSAGSGFERHGLGSDDHPHVFGRYLGMLKDAASDSHNVARRRRNQRCMRDW